MELLSNRIYKIIKIIDEYNVLVDYGLNSHASEGDILNVFVPGKEVIVDEVNYGTLDIIKAQLVVKSVYSKMSLCTNRDKETFSPLERLKNPFTETYIRPLKIDENQKEKLIDDIDKSLRIGDLVRKKPLS